MGKSLHLRERPTYEESGDKPSGLGSGFIWQYDHNNNLKQILEYSPENTAFNNIPFRMTHWGLCDLWEWWEEEGESTLDMGARLGPAGGGRDARVWEKNQLLGMPSSDEGRLALLMVATAVAAARTRFPPATHTQTHTHAHTDTHTHTHTHTQPSLWIMLSD